MRGTTERVWPHLDGRSVAITGGVAIAWHLGTTGTAGRVAGDLDLVAAGLDAVAPSVTRDFLVSHYHRGDKGIVQLVDPIARVRVNIFEDLAGAIARARVGDVGGVVARVLDAPDLLAHKLRTLARGACDEKHWRDAVALASFCGAPAPARPVDLRADRYCTELDVTCARCEASRDDRFPLAPKARIFALLGYV